MKTILVATDFSPAALNGAIYAADMALAINAEILLLHVYLIPFSTSEIPVSMITDEMIKTAENELNRLNAQLDQRTGNQIKVRTEVSIGVFFEQLRTVCDRIRPYTVVMGSQGRTAADRLFFGSHSIYSMKNLMWPLITVPPNANFSAIKNIGLACEFDKVVNTIPVDEIKKLVIDFNAVLHILNVGKADEFKPGQIFESALLESMLAKLKPSFHFITNENTDEGILHFVEKNHIDLLIVLPKRHGLIEKLMYKSHTKQLVLHSHVPVMAVHN